MNERSALQNHLNEVIFGTDTTAGKAFDIFLVIAILSSVTVVFFDSSSRFDQVHSTFITLEWFFTSLFTIEYLARLYCAPRPMRYATSFYGLVDLLSILPTYLLFFLQGSQYFLIIRLLRILRIFRILKLLKYNSEANLLVTSLIHGRRKIAIFLAVVTIFATIFGALMFIVEGPENGFTSIPQSIYWAIVTITTVGYGDIVPTTYIGKFLSTMVMVLGYSILAVPTGIVTAELANEMRLARDGRRCKHCGRAGHETDAAHCRHCGATL